MQANTGLLLIALGLLVLYLVLSDKYTCFVQMVDCMTGADMATPNGYSAGTANTVGAASIPNIQNNSTPNFLALLQGVSGLGNTTPPFAGK